jgi:hypothetical protein
VVSRYWIWGRRINSKGNKGEGVMEILFFLITIEIT